MRNATGVPSARGRRPLRPRDANRSPSRASARSPLHDRAAPAAALVLVHLEADLGVRAHHPHLPALDRVDVERLAVVGVDDWHDIGDAVCVTADPADDLGAQEVVDLGAVELLDHGATLAKWRVVRPDQEVEEAHLREPVGAARELFWSQ